MKRAIIIANGNRPARRTLQYLQKKGFDTIIAADGGADSAKRLGIIPDAIIGDMDSVQSTVLEYFSDASEIIRYRRQNDTDIEKCLKYLIKKKYQRVVLLGATGSRLDHSFCNLGITLKFSDRIKTDIISEKTYLETAEGDYTFKSVPGETISLYGFDSVTKITTQGLKYALSNEALPFGIRESTSNVAESSEVRLKITGGRIFLMRDFNTMRRYDLLV